MKKVISVMLCFLLLAATAVYLTGCGDANASKAKVDENITIRVAHFPNITHAQALVGLADGTFAKALGSKVKIERKSFNAGPEEIEALLAGEVDLGYIGPGPAINGYIKSHGALKIIAGATNAGAVLVVRKDANISKISDLAGKKVAVPQFGNTQDLSLRQLLNSANLKSVDKGGNVQVLQVKNPDILSLFSQKKLDAALVPEPWGARLVKDADGKILLDWNQVWREGKYTTAVVIVSTKFLNAHPDLVHKFLAAHLELTNKISKDPESAKKIINAQIKELTGKNLPKDILDKAFTRVIPTYDPMKDSVCDFLTISYNAGYLKEKVDITPIFALDSLNQILKEKGLPLVK